MMVTNADRVLMTKWAEKQEKEREEHRQGLIDGKPKSLAWAKKLGLTHWHTIGFGCGPRCLEGVGEHRDPDAMNFSRSHSIHLTDEKKKRGLAKRRETRARETRMREADASVNTGRY